MKRRIYVICQKNHWDKGKPQVLSDGNGKLSYIYSKEGLLRAKEKVKKMNKAIGLNPVHIRKATIIVEEELTQLLSSAKLKGDKNGN